MLEEFHINTQQLTEAEIHQPYNEANNIQVFIGTIATFKSDIGNLSTLLSPKELIRANKFVFDMHREVYIISHALLKKQLSKKLSLSVNDIDIEYFEDIKPYLRNTPAIDFNLSHSQEYFSFIIADDNSMRVGVDIEKYKADFKFQSIVESVMHPNEIEYILPNLTINDENRHHFFEIWTRKEAFLKMHGIGIATDLPALDTASTKSISTFQIPDTIQIQSKKSTIHSFNAKNYALSIATNTAKIPVITVLK